jgi:hypothetical protein
MQPVQDDLKRILADFTSNEGALREVIGGLSDQQLNWQSEPRKSWSVLQCASHLALSNESYTGGIRSVPGRGGPPRSGPVRPSLSS